MEGDLEFLEQVKRECPKAEAEWNRRSASRTDELAAIAQAVKILDDDEARDLLTKTTAFVQTAMSSEVRTRYGVLVEPFYDKEEEIRVIHEKTRTI